MAIVVSDTFTDADGTLLQNHAPDTGGPWSKHPSRANDLTIQGNVLDVSSDSTYFVGPQLSGLQYYVEADVKHGGSQSNIINAVCAQMDATADTFYYASYEYGGATQWNLVRRVSGTNTVLASFADATVDQNVFNKLRLEIDGDTKRVYVDTTLIIEHTDSSGSKLTDPGYAGQFSEGFSSPEMDNFVVDEQGGATGATINPTTATTTSDSPDPTASAGASITATTAATTETAIDPQVSAGASVQPTAAASSAAANAPTVTAGAGVSPTTAATESQAPDPGVAAGASVSPDAAETRTTAPAPVVSAGASVSPPTAETVETAHDPLVGSVVIVFPPAATTVSSAPDPAVRAGASVSVPAAQTDHQANDPAVSAGAAVRATTAVTAHAANDPAISAGILPFVRKATIQGTMTRKATLSGTLERKATVPGTLTRKVRL